MIAEAGSYIIALADCEVLAMAGSFVVASDDSRIIAHHSSKVTAESGSFVIAYDGASVLPRKVRWCGRRRDLMFRLTPELRSTSSLTPTSPPTVQSTWCTSMRESKPQPIHSGINRRSYVGRKVETVALAAVSTFRLASSRLLNTSSVPDVSEKIAVVGSCLL